MRSREYSVEPRPPEGQVKPGPLAHAAELTLLLIVYVAAARLGLQMGPVSGFATLVWPPTGIALAALLIRGVRLWPAVLVGAVVANVLSGASVPVALAIGIGNTLEALLAVFLLQRVVRIHLGLDRLVDVLALVALAAGISTLVSATVGVLALRAGGIVQPGHVAETWRAWWVGDALGDLVVAPFLLTWSGVGALTASPRRALEVAVLAVVAAGVSSFLFLVGPPLDPAPVRQAYIVFPVLIWAAIRFGPRGGTTAILVISVFAVWGTLLDSGPFTSETLGVGLLKLHLFMGVATVTTLVLAAVSAERMEALRAEEEILAIVSHDMKNPLGALRLSARHLLKQPATELGPDARRQGEFIARCAQRLESLIANVLDAATIRAGHLTLRRAPQDLAALISDAAETLGPLLEEKSQTFRLEAPPAVRVDVDRERILQVLSNLIGNAVKFAPRNGHITATAIVVNGWAQVLISDDGPGIESDKLEQVFEPYWTGESAQGTGLGLSIVRGIVEAHGGTTSVQSQPGVGTTIGFVIPLASGTPSSRELLMPRVLSHRAKHG